MTADGSQLVRLAVSNLTLTLTDGTHTLVSVTGGTGALLLTSRGGGPVRVSAEFTVPSVTLTVTTVVDLREHDARSSVSENIPVAGDPFDLNLPAGPFVRATAIGATLDVSGTVLYGRFRLRPGDPPRPRRPDRPAARRG